MSLGIRDMSVLMSRVDKKFMIDCLNLSFICPQSRQVIKKTSTLHIGRLYGSFDFDVFVALLLVLHLEIGPFNAL